MNAQHIFQVLTKRADVLSRYSTLLDWTPNIWMGVTVESPRYLNRIDALRRTGAFIKFLSLEPLLSSLGDMDLREIDWVIAGGESGPEARPMEKSWVVEIQTQCKNRQIPFFFKQWGGVNKKAAGSMLDGTYYKEMPLIFHPTLST